MSELEKVMNNIFDEQKVKFERMLSDAKDDALCSRSEYDEAYEIWYNYMEDIGVTDGE